MLLARALATLAAAASAAVLVWLASRMHMHTTGGYWAAIGLLAAGGLLLGLTRLVGRGRPIMSVPALVIAFLPVLVFAGWVVVAAQPSGNWARAHVLAWSRDLHIPHLVRELERFAPALAGGIGLVLGFVFDRLEPVPEVIPGEAAAAEAPAGVPAEERDGELVGARAASAD